MSHGPSPRTRGNLHEAGFPDWLVGSIPAHAGKSLNQHEPGHQSRVHPRVRGEIITERSQDFLFAGPSPRTRGNRRQCHGKIVGSGSIPAHAGKSVKDVIISRLGRVHPRARGEIFVQVSVSQDYEGSIPAHAGKSARGLSRRRRYWVHPRARGEIRLEQAL